MKPKFENYIVTDYEEGGCWLYVGLIIDEPGYLPRKAPPSEVWYESQRFRHCPNKAVAARAYARLRQRILKKLKAALVTLEKAKA